MFDGWQNFFGVLGAAAATLIGLLFIVVTLTSGRSASTSAQGTRLFNSPTVFHLVSVLGNSALALAPGDEEISRRVIMTGWAIVGLIYSGTLAVRLGRLKNPTHWSDFWYYGVAPTLTYMALCAANIATWARAPHAAFFEALCLLALLVVAIRNAWDLVTWLAPRRDSER
jgi:hypothetical protein